MAAGRGDERRETDVAMADNDAQTSEFDDVAAWSAAVLAERDDPTAVVGACRGSGSPAALAWLAEALELGPDVRLLDVGSGLGGPSAWAAARYGARPVGAEVMEGAVRGATRLFGRPGIVAAADALPLPPSSFDAAWTLGVLDTVDRPDRLLAEVRRCLTAGGRFGALAYVAEQAIPDGELPEGNRFPTTDELAATIEAAGFIVVERVGPNGIPTPPVPWQERQNALDAEVERRHGEDPRWAQAHENEQAFADLLCDGRVEMVLLHAACR